MADEDKPDFVPSELDVSPTGPTREGLWSRLRRRLIGQPRDVRDPHMHHKLSLIALLAWVGLGADGLSSSAYGPDEAYRALDPHYSVAILVALATALTVVVISYSYSKIVEHFPHGGGGYVVATQLLGPAPGVVSACALLVDYVLTVTVSIASAGDAVFSLLLQAGLDPGSVLAWKLPAEFGMIVLMSLLNLRGVKESVRPLVPIFVIFLVSHVVLILGAMLSHAGAVPQVSGRIANDLSDSMRTLGTFGFFVLFVRAYSMGAGTYTGIEAVSNGLPLLREPVVATGKRTMLYMAVSLAFMAAGLLFCYVLISVRTVPGQTLNAVLARGFAGRWSLWGMPVGLWFVAIVLFSEAMLLLAAAQAGFISGPRVMTNMARDSWLPHKFASLSDRLTMQNGVLVMGVSAAAILAYTGGSIHTLVIMYSINVFITFSLSQLGMSRFWIRDRKIRRRWGRNLAVHVVAFVLCAGILAIMCVEKFAEGGWMTLLITSLCVVGCFAIRRHYHAVRRRIQRIDELFARIRLDPLKSVSPDAKLTGIVLASHFGGLGIHSILSVLRLFPSAFRELVFVSVGVIDAGISKGVDHVAELEERTRSMLKKYEDLFAQLGLKTASAYRIGTDIVSEACQLCTDAAKEREQSVVIAGEVVFEDPKWYHFFLHNQTAYAIQRRLRHAGLPMIIQPIRLSLHDRSTPTRAKSIARRGADERENE